MARYSNRYSVFIATSKIVLPILGLGLLSSLFLLSQGEDTEVSIPYSDVELQEIVEGQRLAKPSYESVLEGGSLLEIVAESARPDILSPGNFNARDAQARIIRPTGDVIDIYGTTARLDQSSSMLGLSEGVRVEHSRGYDLSSDSADVDIEGGVANTTAQTLITGPGLWLQADRARFELETERAVFTGGVKLIYTPQ